MAWATMPTGRPFYAMRFIQGDSLKEAIAAFHGDEAVEEGPGRARLSRLRELLRRFTDVCNAIAYAHSRGVLHRDLKPGQHHAGPLRRDSGGRLGPGQAGGRVGSSGDGSSLMEGPIRLSGLSGSRAETLAGLADRDAGVHASPEQVTGADRLGPATDIYGLGATLYCLLTGQSPVESNDLGEVDPPGRARRDPPAAVDRPDDPQAAGGDLPEGDGDRAGGSL